MSDVPAWWLYTVIFMQLGISLLIGMRCDTLSKRIDLVHRRISRNSRVNSLIDYWDDEDDGALPPAQNSPEQDRESDCKANPELTGHSRKERRERVPTLPPANQPSAEAIENKGRSQ